MTTALTLSASEHAGVRPVSYDVIPGQTSSGRANSVPMLGCATGVGLAAERGRTAGSRWEWPRLGRPEIDRLVAILRVRISPGLTPETVSNIRRSTCGILSSIAVKM